MGSGDRLSLVEPRALSSYSIKTSNRCRGILNFSITMNADSFEAGLDFKWAAVRHQLQRISETHFGVGAVRYAISGVPIPSDMRPFIVRYEQ